MCIRSVLQGISVTTLMLVAASAFAQEIPEQRLPLNQFKWPLSQTNQAGSAMIQGQQTFFAVGDGKSKALFSIVFKVPPNTKIQPHSHPDDRSCFVLAGTWYFGYGTEFDETKLQELPVGSSYTEPAGRPHFAAAKDGMVIQQCTAIGPTATTFVNPADDPRNAKK